MTPDALSLLGWLTVFDASPFDGASYHFNTEGSERAFSQLFSWYSEGCLRVADALSVNQAFAAREAGLLVTSTSQFPLIDAAMAEAGNSDDWAVLPLMGAGGQAIVLYGPSFVVLETTEAEQLASWLFLRYVLDNQSAIIAAGGFLPTHESQLDELAIYAAENPHWAQAVELLPAGVSEPSAASWSEVRRALSDACGELLIFRFESFQLPGLLEQLQATAE